MEVFPEPQETLIRHQSDAKRNTVTRRRQPHAPPSRPNVPDLPLRTNGRLLTLGSAGTIAIGAQLELPMPYTRAASLRFAPSFTVIRVDAAPGSPTGKLLA